MVKKAEMVNLKLLTDIIILLEKVEGLTDNIAFSHDDLGTAIKAVELKGAVQTTKRKAFKMKATINPDSVNPDDYKKGYTTTK